MDKGCGTSTTATKIHRHLDNWPKESALSRNPSDPSILLLDGGVSTFLQDSFSPGFSHRSLWSSSLLLTASGKDAIRDCHEAFYRAGSDIVSSVTYQCHYFCCGEPKTPEELDGTAQEGVITEYDIDQTLRDGIRLAREAGLKLHKEDANFTRPLFVAASIGCYGGALADGSEYRGEFFQCDINGLIGKLSALDSTPV